MHWPCELSRVDVHTYSQETPKLELREFFEGRVEAWGMFQKRSGEVTKRFHVEINGHSEGSRLILDESFTYSDGTKQKRVWTLTPVGPSQWRGTAGDVVGEALVVVLQLSSRNWVRARHATLGEGLQKSRVRRSRRNQRRQPQNAEGMESEIRL